jgi:hypothetical protein
LSKERQFRITLREDAEIALIVRSEASPIEILESTYVRALHHDPLELHLVRTSCRFFKAVVKDAVTVIEQDDVQDATHVAHVGNAQIERDSPVVVLDRYVGASCGHAGACARSAESTVGRKVKRSSCFVEGLDEPRRDLRDDGVAVAFGRCAFHANGYPIATQ